MAAVLRFLRIVLALLATVLLVAVCIAWALPGRLTLDHDVIGQSRRLSSQSGCLRLSELRLPVLNGGGWDASWERDAEPPDARRVRGILRFSPRSATTVANRWQGTYAELMIRHWLIALALLPLPAWQIVLWIRPIRRRRRGLCLSCAYPLGPSDHCPECGARR